MNALDAENRNLLSVLESYENRLKEESDELLKQRLVLNEEKENLDQRLKVVEEKSKDLAAKICSCEQQIASNDIKITELKEAEVAIANEATEGTQRNKSISALLRNVTQTQWEKTSTDEVLQGTIVRKDDIEPFSFNLTQTSEKDIRDQLWNKLTKNSQSAFFQKTV